MLPAPKSEYEDRVARARGLMRDSEVDGLLVTDPVSFFYFSGQRMPARYTGRPSAFLLPSAGDAVLIAWSGTEMFARVYGRDYPSWVEDRRIYPETRSRQGTGVLSTRCGTAAWRRLRLP